MSVITKAEFLAAEDRPTKDVPLPAELYGPDKVARLRTMSGTERAQLEKRFAGTEAAQTDPGGFRAALLAAAWVDENGELMFSEADATAILDKNAKTLETIVEEACELSGFTKKDVEGLEKNEEAADGTDAPSAVPGDGVPDTAAPAVAPE